MGWFDEQIKLRKKKDHDAFDRTFLRIACAVTGNKKALSGLGSEERAQNAVDEILSYYHTDSAEIPPKIDTPEKRLEYALNRSGIMYRTVELEEGWYKDAFGAMLGFWKEDHEPVALLPSVSLTTVITTTRQGNIHLYPKRAGSFLKRRPMLSTDHSL